MAEKRRGILGSILFWGISLLMTVLLILFLLNFVGFPVWKTFQDWGNKIPVLNLIIPDSNSTEPEVPVGVNDWKEKYLNNEAVLKKREQELTELNKQLSSNQNEIKVLKKNNEDLQKQLEDKQIKEVQDQMKQVSGIYASIPASKAAAMLVSMPLEEASLTISQLDQELQGSILGSMKDVKKAAQITILLKEIAGLDKTNQTELAAQVHELALIHENPTETLAETVAGMPPAQSANIIRTMMATNSQVAMNLMKNIKTTSRSQILTEIAKSDNKLAATIAANLNN
ncbi:MotE family protein [Neobacillus sp. NPDC097160]|uniref:MotE family protein n=1 Tax=Neobacillus sp. NPDC097160 TaxID=3364298 RepID=UPI0038303731